MSNSPEESGQIDKSQLYGNYQSSEKWRDDLNRRATHKALDMALQDDVNITTSTTHHHASKSSSNYPGYLALVMSLATAVGLALFFHAVSQRLASDDTDVSPTLPEAVEYRVIFEGEDGVKVQQVDGKS
jgi:capsular polysaccharide biosynthesis protein